MTNHITNYLSDSVKHIIDTASVLTVLGTLVDFLPAVAASFTIIWTGIRIWETDTVKNIVKKWKK